MASPVNVPITKGKGIVEIDTEAIPVEVYKEALLLGLKELANRGMSKLTKASFNGDEAALAEAAMKQAEKNVEAINSGDIRFSGKKAKTGESAAVMTEARRLAKALIKDAIKANGEKISHYEPKEITALANAYLAEDTSLIEQAKANLEERAKAPTLEKLKSVVATGLKASPKLVAKAEAAKSKKKETLSKTQAGKVAPRVKPKGSQPTAH
jgi:hypothetical protein